MGISPKVVILFHILKTIVFWVLYWSPLSRETIIYRSESLARSRAAAECELFPRGCEDSTG